MAPRKINPSELPSNDREPRNTPPAPIAVVSGRTKDKGRSLSHEVRTIINDLFSNVVIPSTKSMIFEFLSDGLRQMILGKSNPGGARGLPVHRAYHSMYNDLSGRAKPMGSLVQRAGIPQPDVIHQDIYFDYEQDARLVLASMLQRQAQYGRVSLGDMRHLARLPSDAVHNRYGWTDIGNPDIVLTSEGYIILLPELQYK
jgi:hypothetical protein